MAMGKLHKEIGNFIVQAVEDTDRTDAQVIKVSNKKKVLSISKEASYSCSTIYLWSISIFQDLEILQHCSFNPTPFLFFNLFPGYFSKN